MHVLIIGYGASGRAAHQLLLAQGHSCSLYDDQLPGLALSVEELAKSSFDLAIVSPGIALTHPICALMYEKGVALKGEAEYALSFLPQKKIGITGTNGKTTLTYLCEHILKLAGYQAIACGNVSKEKALSTQVLQAPQEAILVVELSSFQLETLSEAHFEVGIILNVTPDHLDRYPSMAAYAKAKCRLIPLCSTCWVYQPIKEAFGDLVPIEASIYDNQSAFVDFPFASPLDRQNAYSAYLLLQSFNINQDTFIEGLKTFVKPQHRLQKVLEISGVSFINDSKATNIDATIQALLAQQGPVLLLAGGFDKGHPYTAWLPFLGSVKEIICFGQAGSLIFEQLSPHIACKKIETLEEATYYAYDRAQAGDTVLLSPGCSSFDAFKDYQDRGQKFCQYIQSFKTKEILI